MQPKDTPSASRPQAVQRIGELAKQIAGEPLQEWSNEDAEELARLVTGLLDWLHLTPAMLDAIREWRAWQPPVKCGVFVERVRAMEDFTQTGRLKQDAANLLDAVRWNDFEDSP